MGEDGAGKPGFWERALVAALTSAWFVIIYSTCNRITAGREHHLVWMFDWERRIPLVPIFIVPYMSIDLLFAAAPFFARTRKRLWNFAARVGLAVPLAALGFLLLPLTLGIERKVPPGIFAPIFDFLFGFDQPHNLFPSLHIALAFILRWIYHDRLRGPWRWLVHLWLALISLSTVLVHQHHLVDLAGGAALGLGVCYLLPYRQDAQPPHRPGAVSPGRVVLSALTAGALIGVACWLRGWWLLLLWPGTTFLLTALAAAWLGPWIWHTRDGVPTPVARIVMAPWLVPLCLSRRWYWRRMAPCSVVLPGLMLGRLPRRADAGRLRQLGVTGILDLAAEHGNPLRDTFAYESVPLYDLALPNDAQLDRAVAALERLRDEGGVLVHCALGYGRSALVTAAYLLKNGDCASVDEACALVEAKRPGVVLRKKERGLLRRFPSHEM